MPAFRSGYLLALTATFLLASTTSLVAQDAPAGPFRKLAPGVEKVIPAPQDHRDAFSRHDLIDVLAADPEFGVRQGSELPSPAKNVRFQHDVWGLEFTFKPVRFIRVEVPGKDGKKQEKLVWYLYYHVRNPGDQPVRFIPQFTLESIDIKQTYAEELLPNAVAAIRRREDPNRPLLNTIEMAGTLEPGQEKWGVATWSSVAPETDHFAVFVTGLSNAYRWEEGGEPDQPNYTVKTLKLNFWRPGDAQYQHEQEIRFGAPEGAAGEVDYEWIYR